jgi:prepilin-type N-terminal cleavage/methylation domain-containing protein
MKRRGFTLIEALSVIAIIGILMSLSGYVILQAQVRSRDTKRKSDLSAIAQGFEARKLDRTCSNQSEVGYYPGKFVEPDSTTGVRPWTEVVELNSITDDCNSKTFTAYLSEVPTDPSGNSYPYYFNLSSGRYDGEHYRLAAALERPISTSDQQENCRQSLLWHDTFIGQYYDGCNSYEITPGSSRKYTYYIGK